MALDAFDVSLALGGPTALLGTRDGVREAVRWSLRELRPGYVAAVSFPVPIICLTFA